MSRRSRAPRSGSGGYQAGPGTVVSFHYALFDAEGELVEEGSADSPTTVLLGYGEVAPALESAFSGLVAGDVREVLLDEADAFGRRDPEAIIEVDRDDLPADLEPGDELTADKEGGGTVLLKVLEILDDIVVLDTNHPLAGQRVRLQLSVESVRPATADELSQAEGRLARTGEPASQPLLPVERLLRRGGSNSPQGDEAASFPPPSLGGSGRVA
ncbi:MAG TPA: FKBP-type peptidyl-prolyl cis-trans isomerase [Polyangiaceae bacterium]|nr:FKBP-type peptidyl-prolyl cis-trans isomerase [Polyangiaceae bacterium]